MPETHVASEEVRKLAERIVDGEGLPKEWWDERDDRKSKDIEIEWTAQLLSSALRANKERVLEDVKGHYMHGAAQRFDRWLDGELKRCRLAVQPAAGKEPSRG